MDVFKRKDFARWQSRERIGDPALCDTAREIEHGLVGVKLGGALHKKRLARSGKGKSGGYRVIVAVRACSRAVFLHGFAKANRANITAAELQALRFMGKVLLDLDAHDLGLALETGVLAEVCCDQQDH